MAGWKLRKDKASAETPDAEAETSSTEIPYSDSVPSSDSAHSLDTAPGLPEFDAADHDLGTLGFDHETVPPSPLDGPLTLVDYTDDGTAAQEPHAQVYDQAYELPPATNSVFAMPPPEPAEQAAEETENGFEALPASSSWLSSDFSADTPPVAPFVLDTPAPTAAPAAPPRITVRIGRLSAPFDLTKDVTTIGRPDSALHYYPDIEIEMDDAVSRRHCEIVERETGYSLVDTGSTNGTRLNGETLLPHQEHLLAHGDRIHLGDRTEIVFE